MRGCFAASCVMALIASASAAAQTGVHVDPGSPAGQEYAVPLQAARGDFDGGTTKGKTNSGTTKAAPTPRSTPTPTPTTQPSAPPSFGTGIIRAKPKPKRPARTRSNVPKPDVTRPVKVAAAPRLPDVDADSTVSPTAVTGGIAAAVLLLALAVAAASRRARRTTSA